MFNLTLPRFILPSFLLGIFLITNITACTEQETSTSPKNYKVIKSDDAEKLSYLSYENALNVATKTNKLIMIKLTAEHCHFCIKMDKKVMVEKEVIQMINTNFVPVEIDINKDVVPLGLSKSMTPTFIFVNEKEEIVKKIPGSWNKEDFMDILQSALNAKGK